MFAGASLDENSGAFCELKANFFRLILTKAELVSLKPEDIYLSTMQVYISKGKNHRDRWTILSERALDLLKEYWRSYPVKREYLFVSLDAPHEPLKVSGVEIMLRAVGKTAGIEAHPHTLRHSFASHMIEQGVHINYVQAMLGHRCLESTQVYIHISNKTVMTSPFRMHFIDFFRNTVRHTTFLPNSN